MSAPNGHGARPTRSELPDVATDVGLRAALACLSREQHLAARIWDQLGEHILKRAERDSQGWQRHAAEYVGAYAVAAFELLKLRPDRVARAGSPWGVVVSAAQRAGRRAVGEDMAGGLTARDERTHRVRLSAVPKVVSLDAMADRTGFAVAGGAR